VCGFVCARMHVRVCMLACGYDYVHVLLCVCNSCCCVCVIRVVCININTLILIHIFFCVLNASLKVILCLFDLMFHRDVCSVD